MKKDMEEEAINKIIKAKKSDFKWHEDVHVAFQKAKEREKREAKAKAKKRLHRKWWWRRWRRQRNGVNRSLLRL